MPVTYDAPTKTARITTTRDQFANGTVEIRDSSDTPLVIFGLSASGGDITGDTWTLVLDAETVSAAATGIAAKAVIKTAGGTAGITGLTVGESGADVTIDNVDINMGQEVTLTAASIQHAA